MPSLIGYLFRSHFSSFPTTSALFHFPTHRRLTTSDGTGNESVPIQLAQCRFPGLAITNTKTLIYFFYKEAILSNISTRKLLWFEITKMLIAV